jgi:hypothetical protein
MSALEVRLQEMVPVQAKSEPARRRSGRFDIIYPQETGTAGYSQAAIVA